MTDTLATRTGYRWQMTAPGAPLVRADFDLPEPEAGQALVRVAGCGVCHTDVGFLFDGVAPRSGLPLALGHEISGEVVAAGADFEDLRGRAVIVPAVTPCDRCDLCRAGHGSICAHQTMPGNDIQGGFADHVLVPAHGLCPVDDPAALAGEVIGASGCTLTELSVLADAVTTPFQALRRAGVGAGDFVVVVGLGGVGGFAAQIAAALGARVVGFDLDAGRVEALSGYGLCAGFDPSGEPLPRWRKRLREIAREQGASAERWKIFECSGSASGQELAWRLLGPGAYLSIIGYTQAKTTLRLSNLMAFDAKAAGNWGCLPALYPEALAMVLEGRVALAPFVERRPMDSIQEVLEELHHGSPRRRPVLVP